ncbi:CTP synthase [Xylaria scruposa]|nr:CTP synthase [Xylaria scruposa]
MSIPEIQTFRFARKLTPEPDSTMTMKCVVRIISGVGKGFIASSIGLLPKTIGLTVTMIKIDPYMNADAGTMSPAEHGECFAITAGKMYLHVIQRERKGDYLGKRFQIERVAHIPVDETLRAVIELGGTFGDIENGPFVEALRQLKRKAGKDNFLYIHVSLIPVIHTLRSVGLNPDQIVCRRTDQFNDSTIGKVANHCQVDLDQVIAVSDVPSTYIVPITLEKQDLASISGILNLRSLHIPPGQIMRGAQTWTLWKTLVQPREYLERVTIALVGKYTGSIDAYMSLVKSLQHAAMACQHKLNLLKIHTAQGILVPGGFGARGTEGMIDVIRYARENKVPFMGICLGMQLAVVEFARNVCGLSANSAEIDKQTPHPVVDMPEINFSKYDETMRLGEKPKVFAWSKVHAAYADSHIEGLVIQERHRHREEVNPLYIETLAGNGLEFVGKDEKGERNIQFHPKYRSKVIEPSMSILGFAAKCAGM